MSEKKDLKVTTVKSECLMLLKKHRGTLRARYLVEYARTHPKSALHARIFRLGDAEAAGRWRLEEAARIIRHFSIRVEHHDRPDVKTRLLVSPPSDRKVGGGVYRDIRLIQGDEARRQELIDMARRELQAFVRKYETLRDVFSGVFMAIEELKFDEEDAA